MSTEVIVALVTGLCGVAAMVISNVIANNKMSQKIDKTQAVFEAHVTEQIQALTKQVEKHNTIIERTYKLEESSALHEAELKRLNKRLELVEH